MMNLSKFLVRNRISMMYFQDNDQCWTTLLEYAFYYDSEEEALNAILTRLPNIDKGVCGVYNVRFTNNRLEMVYRTKKDDTWQDSKVTYD